MSANSDVPPPRLPAKSRLLALLTVFLAVLAGGVALRVRDDWTRATWREGYLPELLGDARTRTNEPYLLVQLALRQLEARQHANAAESLEAAVSAGLSVGPVWRTLAAANAAAGNPNGAMAALKLGARDPKLKGELEMAAKRLELAVDGGPEAQAQAIAPEGIGLLAGLQPPNWASKWIAARGERDPATAGFETIAALAKSRPDDVAVKIAWARALARNRRFPDAEAELIPLLKRNPEDYEAALALADVRYDAGVPARAGIIYRACLKERPADFRAAMGVLRCAVDVKLVYLGVEAGLVATKLQPKSPEAWVLLGRAYFNQKLRWDKAVEAFATARELDPARSDYFAAYYDSLRANNRLDEGVAVLRARVAAAPEDPQALYLLATGLLEGRADPGVVEEAESLLRKSLAIEPRVTATRARLAQILLDRGGEAEAEESSGLLEQAVLLDPYHALSRRLLARAYRMRRLVKEAQAVERSAKALDAYIQRKMPLEDAQATNPTDPEIHRKLAAIYRSGGEEDKAVSAEQMAYLLKHRKEDAEKGLKTLMNATSLSASTEWTNAKRREPAKGTNSKP